MGESDDQAPAAVSALGPTEGSERKVALDTLRGVALLGILLMNIVSMGLPFSYSDPTISGGAEGPDLAAWAINNLFFEGTMRGLFSLMFGAGIVLMTSRAEARGGGAVCSIRCARSHSRTRTAMRAVWRLCIRCECCKWFSHLAILSATAARRQSRTGHASSARWVSRARVPSRGAALRRRRHGSLRLVAC